MITKLSVTHTPVIASRIPSKHIRRVAHAAVHSII
jgi:hypothetical protein